MANDQIEEVKQKIDIVNVISEYVHLKKAGRNFKGICPFHGEKSPSFMVNQELQIFKCFGCQEGGDVISFLQKIEGLEFGEALQNLAKRVGITLTSYKPTGQEQLKERLYKLIENAGEVYHFVLCKHPSGKTALEYALGRGITLEAIEKFKLGFAPEGWSFMTNYLTKKKDYTEKELENAGLLIVGNRGGYDRFRNRLMFPLTNSRGQVVGFAGRVLPGADEKAGGKYINSPETELYHKGELLYGFDINRSEIKLAKFAVVVEGEIDAIASWQAGVKNVVAIKGSGLTDRQVELISRVAETVVMALDADLAGDAAARRGIQIAESKGLVVKVVVFEGGGKDPGDIATKEPEKWRKMVEEAIGVYDFYLQSAVKRYGLEAISKQKIGKELLPIWAAIDDEILRAHYVGKLAEVLGVRDEDVRNQMAKLKVTSSDKNDKQEKNNLSPKEVEIKEGREAKEARVVMLTVLGKREEELKKKEIKELFKGGVWKRVIEGLVETGREGLPAELLGKLNEVLMTDEDYSEKAWSEAVKLLELVNIEEELRNTEDLEVVRKLGNRKAALLKEL